MLPVRSAVDWIAQGVIASRLLEVLSDVLYVQIPVDQTANDRELNSVARTDVVNFVLVGLLRSSNAGHPQWTNVPQIRMGGCPKFREFPVLLSQAGGLPLLHFFAAP